MKLRIRPSTALNQRVVRNKVTANENDAPSANPTPAVKAGPGAMPLPPMTPSAMVKPNNAIGIAIATRRAGRSPPPNHEMIASMIGKVLKVSSASATGIRATAE